MRKLVWAALFLTAAPVVAQESAETDGSDEIVLLTQAQLEELLAPVALYPDTILIQILVGATAPDDVRSADALISENTDTTPEDLKPIIEAEGYDASVEVLAETFPSVVTGMANHMDWTQAVGIAMINQTDDVMNTVQVLRDQAIEAGALIETAEGEQVPDEVPQVVSRDASENVVIVPSDPEVVYVPQYDPQIVYVEDNDDPNWDDWLVSGLFIWGAFTIIDDIFDDDDDWYGYWGCRNCGGWNDGPIIWNPDVDIDIDGDVNIGNWNGERFNGGHPNIDRDGDIQIGDRTINNVNIDTGDNTLVRRDGDRVGNGNQDFSIGGDHITNIKENGGDRENIDLVGASTRPDSDDVNRDAMRENLSEQTGAQDISRSETAAAVAGATAGAAALKDRGETAKAPVQRPVASKKPAPKAQANAASVKAKPAVSKQSTGSRAKAASSRGGGKMQAKGGGRQK